MGHSNGDQPDRRDLFDQHPGAARDLESHLGYFTGTANVQDVSGYTSLFEGMSGYLWIRNNSNTENFLANTASWTFPVKDLGCCPTGVTTWSVSNLVDDTPVWGSHDDKHGGGDGGVYYSVNLLGLRRAV